MAVPALDGNGFLLCQLRPEIILGLLQGKIRIHVPDCKRQEFLAAVAQGFTGLLVDVEKTAVQVGDENGIRCPVQQGMKFLLAVLEDSIHSGLLLHGAIDKAIEHESGHPDKKPPFVYLQGNELLRARNL